MKQSTQRKIRAELEEFRSDSEEELQEAQRRDLADSKEMARIEDEEGMCRRRLMLSGVDPETREHYTPEHYQALLHGLDPAPDESHLVDYSLLPSKDADLDSLKLEWIHGD